MQHAASIASAFATFLVIVGFLGMSASPRPPMPCRTRPGETWFDEACERYETSETCESTTCQIEHALWQMRCDNTNDKHPLCPHVRLQKCREPDESPCRWHTPKHHVSDSYKLIMIAGLVLLSIAAPQDHCARDVVFCYWLHTTK